MKRPFIFLLLVGMAVVGWFTFRHLPQPSPVDSVDHVPQESGITTEVSRVNEPQKPLVNPSPATNARITLKERLSKVDLNKIRYPGMAVAELLRPEDEDEWPPERRPFLRPWEGGADAELEERERDRSLPRTSWLHLHFAPFRQRPDL